MAIAEPALRNFGIQGLRRSGIRGGNLLATAVGAGIGIAWGLYEDYAMSIVPISPGGHIRQPKPGVSLDYETPSYDGAYSKRQALRTTYKRSYRSRRSKKQHSCSCCCCR